MFEMLILESFQAGLSWECVLNKREDFRKISVITDVCKSQICGLGKDSYKRGIDLLIEML